MKFGRSAAFLEEAQRYMPGGVNSPVRAFKAVGGNPLFIQKGQGSHIYDVDGNEFIDYVCSWGPLILGHAHPQVVEAIKQAADRGTSFGAPTELEIELARTICAAMPSIEMVRFVNSGTEATMSALRLARAFTKRDKVLKFSGGYHGHSDGLLTRAGSGLASFSIPESPGVPSGYAQSTVVIEYNDIEAVEQTFQGYGQEIAAVILEPVAANMGVVPPYPGFLEGLRRITSKWDALLIFDEVITGFRVAYGGAQALYGVCPDLTCLGKVIGGGLPVGAYGGRRDIMKMVSPLGPVYQAGTLSGNPLAMAAGLETLRLLGQCDVYGVLEARSYLLVKLLERAASRAGIPLQVQRTGSLLTPFFHSRPITSYNRAQNVNTKLYASFFHHMLKQGIYLPASQFEAIFVSLAHSQEDIETTGKAAVSALAKLTKQLPVC
jgi:glutamate-1-semialdehyde 2,1-aminomutase